MIFSFKCSTVGLAEGIRKRVV